MRVCLVTRDIIGPVRNGGIGTAFSSLAYLLAEDGHQVTILYALGDYCECGTITEWVEFYNSKGIKFVALPEDGKQYRNSPGVSMAYRVYSWLKAQDDFDTIHFHDWHGLGFFTVQAKKSGLAFQRTHLVVQLHAQLFWHLQYNEALPENLEMLESDYMERSSIEWADEVISPSQYMLDWTAARGWKLPACTRVIQNVMEASPLIPTRHHTINELVFFGRLEKRKGIDIFCQALDKIVMKPKLTFLGKESMVDGLSARQWLAKRLQDCDWQVIDNYDSQQAQDYLKGEGRLAVIASRMENSPYVVLECLVGGIPMLASNAGGTSELISEAERNRVLFELKANKLEEKLQIVLQQGIIPARPAVDPEVTRQQWRDYHRKVKDFPAQPTRSLPGISVCMAHRNRPELLKRALASLEQQRYQPVEVIIVDDGSTDQAALNYISELEQTLPQKGWRVIRQENRYAGAARNRAASDARGDYLLFMDDDNIALPEELEIFAKAAAVSGADILTCAVENIDEVGNTVGYYLPLGGAISAGFYENSYGDLNALVKREVFTALGGFTQDYGLGLEDMEFFARATLAGYRLEVVPEILFRYRNNVEGVQNNAAKIPSLYRAMRPYHQRFPEITPALLLAQGYHQLMPKKDAAYKGLHKGFEEVRDANHELHASLGELKQAKLALDNQVARVEAERQRLEVMMQEVGEAGIAFHQRMNARRVTRVLTRKIIAIINRIVPLPKKADPK